MQISNKIKTAFIPLTLITLIAFGGAAYWQVSRMLTDNSLEHLRSVASIQESRVDDYARFRNQSVALIASRTQLRLSMRKYMETGGDADLAKMRKILGDALNSMPALRGIALIDRRGKHVALVGDLASEPPSDGYGNYTRAVSGRPFVRIVRTSRDEVVHHFAAPMVLESEPLGFVVASFEPDELNAIVQDYTGLGSTGETLLAAPGNATEGSTASFIVPLRFDAAATLTRTVTSPSDAEPMFHALNGRAQTFASAQDYRKHEVLAVSRYVSSTGWGLVVKVDRSEAYAVLQRMATMLLIIALVALVLYSLAASWIARRMSIPIEELRNFARRIAGGDLDAKTPDSVDGEIGELTDAFRRMTQALIGSQHALEKSRDDLESQVRLRTIELEDMNRQLTIQASTDPLTGINNRRDFDDELNRAWRHCIREGASLAVIMVDIDYFKNYNDSLGHEAGDQALIVVAQRLETCAGRPLDRVVRYGGEEFVVVLPNTTLEQALLVAERMRTQIEAAELPHPASQIGPHLTVSVGVGAADAKPDVSPVSLLHRADQQLYAAKQAGRNRVMPQLEALERKLKLVSG